MASFAVTFRKSNLYCQVAGSVQLPCGRLAFTAAKIAASTFTTAAKIGFLWEVVTLTAPARVLNVMHFYPGDYWVVGYFTFLIAVIFKFSRAITITFNGRV